MTNDIRKTGTGGLKGLKGLNQQSSSQNSNGFLENLSKSDARTLARLYSPTEDSTSVGLELANKGFGKSVYDFEALTMQDTEDLDDFRGKQLSWGTQLANGVLKFGTTFATTFVADIVGGIYGLGKAIYNLFDDDPNTGWDAIWNNEVNAAMADIQNKMEELLPNYMTNKERNANFLLRLLSPSMAANTWASIIQNAGFMAGTMASFMLTGGVGTVLKGTKLIGAISKFGKTISEMGKFGKAASTVGKFAKGTAKRIIGATGEASIEAINAYKDNKKQIELNLENRTAKLSAQFEQQYKDNIARGMNPQLALAIFNQQNQKLLKDKQAYLQLAEKELIDSNNGVYLANIAALTVSNELEMKSLISGGYGPSKKLFDSIKRTVDGKVTNNVKEQAKGLLKGTLKTTQDEIKNKNKKIIGRYLLAATLEGVEEAVQNQASNTGLMNVLGKLNKWAHENSMLGNAINPDATEALADYTNAFVESFNENFGAANALGWTEFGMGMVSGLLGIPGVKRNENGKLKLVGRGGYFEAKEAITGAYNQRQKVIDLINKNLSESKYGERAKRAVQGLSISEDLKRALMLGDIQGFKNAELKNLLTDALYYKRMGLLDVYKQSLEEVNGLFSDKDIELLIEKTSDPNSKEASMYQGMTSDEIKDKFQKKSESNKRKVENILNHYDEVTEKFKDKFTSAAEPFAFEHITYLLSLKDDLLRRKQQLEQEKLQLENEHKNLFEENGNNKNKEENKEENENENNENNTNNSKNEELNLIKDIKYTQEVKAKEKGISNIDELLKSLNEEINKTYEDPSYLQKQIDEEFEHARKRERYKEVANAIEDLKNAKSVKDMIDVYRHTSDDTGYDIIELALKEDDLDPEVKLSLTNLKNFLDDVELLHDYINDKYDVKEEDDEKTAVSKLSNRNLFYGMLDSFVTDILSSENPELSQAQLRNKFQEFVDNYTKRIKEIQDTHDVEDKDINDLDEFVNDLINQNFENGELTDDDFGKIVQEDGSIVAVPKTENSVNKYLAFVEMFNKKQDLKELNGIMEHLNKLDELKASGLKPKRKTKKKDSSKKKPKREVKKKVENQDETEDNEENEIEDEVNEEEDNESEDIDVNELFGDGADKCVEVTRTNEYTATVLKAEHRKDSKESTRTTKVKEKIRSKSGCYFNLLSVTSDEISEEIKHAIADYLNEVISEIEKQVSILGSNTNVGNKIKAYEKLLKIADEKIVNNKLASQLDIELNAYKRYKKPEPKAKTAKTENKTETKAVEKTVPLQEGKVNTGGRNVGVYLRGTNFMGYYAKELNDNPENRQAKPYNTSSVNLWLNQRGYNPLRTVDLYLSKIMERDAEKENSKDCTKLYYLHNNELENCVFLSLKYSEVKDIIPKEDVDIIKVNGLEYVLFGISGYDAMTGNEAKSSFSSLLSNMQELHKQSSDEWIVGKNTNRIRYAKNGLLVHRLENDSKKQVRPLRELLDNPERNPHNLTADSALWLIIEGEEGNTTQKRINVSDETIIRDLPNANPGQVYLLLPNADGTMVPVLIKNIFFSEYVNQLTDNKSNPFMNEIHSKLLILLDSEADTKEKKKAIGLLSNMLIFSESNQIHYNDENANVNPNTIAITSTNNVKSLVVINLDSVDLNNFGAQFDKLFNAIVLLNPRINIEMTTLRDLPSFYVDSNLLLTDIATLNTVNASYYTHPVDVNTGEYVESKPVPKAEKQPSTVNLKSIYFNKQQYFYDGKKFYDKDKNIIDDEDGYLKIAFDIDAGKPKQYKIGRKKYYVVGNEVFALTGHKGGIELIEDNESILKSIEKQKKKEAKQNKILKEANKIKKEEAAQNSTETSEENTTNENEENETSEEETAIKTEETTNEENEDKTKTKSTKEKSNFSNGTNITNTKTNKELLEEKNNITFVLSLTASRKSRQFAKAIERKFGVKPKNATEIESILVEKGIDLTGDIDVILDNLENC